MVVKVVEDFEEKLKDFLKKYEDKIMKLHEKFAYPTTDLKTLYHYTSIDGLRRILEQRQVCYTDYRYLNDPTELILANSIIKSEIENFTKQDVTECLVKRFWDCFQDQYPKILNHSSVYTFSLSDKHDYLPAWRWYGDNGMGYSIGFDSKYFNESSIDVNNPPEECPEAKIKICYDESEFRSRIKDFLTLTNETLQSSLKEFTEKERTKHFDIIKKKLLDNLIIDLSGNLISITPGFKDRGFNAEEEYRLYLMEIVVNGKVVTSPIARKFNTEREKKLELQRPCLSIDPINLETKIPRALSKVFKHDDICEIWVGPRLDFGCAKAGIDKLLTKFGYDQPQIKKIEIKKSEAPYRG